MNSMHCPESRSCGPDALLCREVYCDVTRDGMPLYFDSHHLTLRGGTMLEPLFAEIFSR